MEDITFPIVGFIEVQRMISRKGTKIKIKTPGNLCVFAPWRLGVK